MPVAAALQLRRDAGDDCCRTAVATPVVTAVRAQLPFYATAVLAVPRVAGRSSDTRDEFVAGVGSVFLRR